MKALCLAFFLMLVALSYSHSNLSVNQITLNVAVPGPPVAASDIQADDHLFPVMIKNKVGFINASGKLVLPAIYENAQEFSEGLCAVRYGGLYGFIDMHGVMVIKPVFDYATQFREGLALVYDKGEPYFIDMRGQVVIHSHYAEMEHFHKGRARVRTTTGKSGVINKAGTLVIDTIFQTIRDFNGGLAVADGIGHEPYGSDETPRNLRTTVIDTLGNILIPFGTFQEILGPYEGHFIATYPTKRNQDYNKDVIIDSHAKVLHRFGRKDSNWSTAKISNGIFRISRYRSKDLNSTTYDVYITLDGKTVVDNKFIEQGKDFSEGFAFWRDESGVYHLMNRNGKVIGKYDDVIGDGFKNGLAIVKTNNLWGIIDTTAAFVVTPRFADIYETSLYDNCIFFQNGNSDSNSEDHRTYGVADIHGTIIIPPSFQFFDARGFVNGLLKTWVDNRVTFFNRDGVIIWQSEDLRVKETHAFNIDFMQRGYFYAQAESTGHPTWNRATPQKISTSNNFPLEAFSFIVRPEYDTIINNEIKGVKAFVVNATNDTLIFNAQDSRLYIKMQAMDSNQQWRDIEYLPSSWCGNSYHTTELPNGYFWEFAAIAYEGSVRTKLRLELSYIAPADVADLQRTEKRALRDLRYGNLKEVKIYSNEFDGSINPGQFWRKPDYAPLNIMDPYND